MAEITQLVISLSATEKAVSLSLTAEDCKQACGDPDAFLNRLIKPAIARLMADYFEQLAAKEPDGKTDSSST